MVLPLSPRYRACYRQGPAIPEYLASGPSYLMVECLSPRTGIVQLGRQRIPFEHEPNRGLFPVRIFSHIARRVPQGRASSTGSRALRCSVTCRSLVATPVTPPTRGRDCPVGIVIGLGKATVVSPKFPAQRYSSTSTMTVSGGLSYRTNVWLAVSWCDCSGHQSAKQLLGRRACLGPLR